MSRPLPAARRSWGRITLAALAAVIVLAAASAVILSMHGMGRTSGSPPTAHGAGASSATPTVVTSPTATLDATATPSPLATADPTITVTATALPYLNVNPTTIQCSVPNPPTFAVQNVGGGTLTWTATTESGYTITPASGSLAGGQQTSVQVSNILTNGTITVAAEGVAGSPQTVMVKCL